MYAESIRVCTLILLDFSRASSFSFPTEAKPILKSGIAVIRWKFVELFQAGIGVCEYEKGTGQVVACYLDLLRNH